MQSINMTQNIHVKRAPPYAGQSVPPYLVTVHGIYQQTCCHFKGSYTDASDKSEHGMPAPELLVTPFSAHEAPWTVALITHSFASAIPATFVPWNTAVTAPKTPKGVPPHGSNAPPSTSSAPVPAKLV